jgi:hypothetical protein
VGRDENRVSEPAREFEGVRAVGGDPDGWVGFLHRLGYEADVVGLVEAAVEGELVVGERDVQIVECLDHAVPALGQGDTETGEVSGLRAPADAELNPPSAEHVERGDLLRGSQWVREGQLHDRRTEPQGRGTRRYRRKQQRRAR